MSKNLEQAVNQRVRTVYYLRLLAVPVFFKPFFLVILFSAIWFKVSVTNILHNAMAIGSPVSIYRFGTAAFSQTEWAVKLLVLGLILVAVWLLIDFARKIPLSRTRLLNWG